MPNSKLDDGEIILDESKTQSNLDFILSGGGGGSGVSWFEEISATDYIGEPPFPQHGISMYNSNCGQNLLFANSPYDEMEGVFYDVYDYPSGDIGICETMFYTPTWYEISQADIDDDNFFSIFEFGGDAVSQYDYFPTIENVDNVQIVFGKHIGSGNVIFFGDVEPAWNNGSPNYYGAVNLLGNIILLNVNDSSKMGCTDILACNFNISSLIDDGSCIYPDLGYDCDGNVADIEESQNNFSLSFDGTDDNVLVNHSVSFESMEYLTISFDIKFDAYPSNYVSGGGVNLAGYRILEKWNNSNSSRSFEINIHNEGTLSSDQSNIPAQISACVNAGCWNAMPLDLLQLNEFNRIDLVFDGDSLYSYLHGDFIQAIDIPNFEFVTYENNPISIAKSLASGHSESRDFLGELDNFSIWEIPLTPEQVELFSNCPITGQEDGLVAYWNFNEGSGDTVYDLSGNNNHGLINGALFSEDVPENNCNESEVVNEINLFSNQSLNSNLVAYYPFNGNANDESGNENHPNFNSATLSIDRFGDLSAYEFNNSNIEIDIPFYDNSRNDYTFSFWFLTDNINKPFQTIFNTIPHDGEGVSFNHPNTSGQLSHWKTQTVNVHEWSTFDGTGNPFFDDIQEDQWYFVVVIKEGIDYKYYINGNLTQISTPEQENNTGLTGIRFGNIGSGEYLSGKLDDFGIWDRALNDNEVLELYLRLEGCTDSLACNYNPEANMADGSCTFAEEGFDCDGNIEVEIGDEVFGGVVFYVEEGSDGQYGLVASTDYIGTGLGNKRLTNLRLMKIVDILIGIYPTCTNCQ